MDGLGGGLNMSLAEEEERIRRLAARVERDKSDGAELAREQRARQISADFQREAPATSAGGAGLQRLERDLDNRRRDQINAMAANDAGTKEQKRNASEMLSQALEQISVRAVLDFRNVNPSPEAEAAAATALVVIAGIDDTVEVDPGTRLPRRSWDEVQKVLSKPGHFINSLRRFPYAVDSGRAPEQNIVEADKYLATSNLPALEKDHQVALNLHRWIEAAVYYYTLRSVGSESKDTGISGMASPEAMRSGGRTSTGKAKPKAASNATPAAPRGGGYPQAAAKRQVVPTSRPRASPGAATSPGAAREATNSRGGSEVSRGGVSKAQAYGVPKRTPPRSQQPSSPMNDLSGVSAEDFRQQLERTKREVREIRSLEAQVKWNMGREEQRERNAKQKEGDKEIMDWRNERTEGMKEYVETKKKEVKLTELTENRDFQEFKRERKEEERRVDKQYVSDLYVQDTENAAWETNLKKCAIEEKKIIVEEHLQEFTHLKEYRIDQKIMDKRDEEDSRSLEKNLAISWQAKELQKQKEQLLQNLEFARTQQGHPCSAVVLNETTGQFRNI